MQLHGLRCDLTRLVTETRHDKPGKIKPKLKAIRGKPRASARHGAIQMPTFNSWLASQHKLGFAMFELTIKLKLSYQQAIQIIVFLLTLYPS